MKKVGLKGFWICTLLFLSVGYGPATLDAQCPPPCTGATEPVSWNGWDFSFRRPCLTEGTDAGGRGGGLEITDVNFNGRRVLFKGHLPILNVKYQNDLCGPFRDWQFQESRYNCVGKVVSDGRCEGTAVTNCSDPPGGDVGSFCGVTVDRSDPGKLVLTSLVQAGWYRYQLEWHFFLDGSFRPVIRWTAVQHPCLVNSHIHSAFWRLDFDIDTFSGEPNVIEEFNDPPLASGYWEVPWDKLFVEMDRMKDVATFNRWWRVRNTSTDRAYIVFPPETRTPPLGNDGGAIAPKISDVWALHFEVALQQETDDCAGTPPLCSLGGSGGYWAHLSRFIDQTRLPNLLDTDVVFWYGASHFHQGNPDGVPSATDCDELNGPLIVPDPAGPPW